MLLIKVIKSIAIASILLHHVTSHAAITNDEPIEEYRVGVLLPSDQEKISNSIVDGIIIAAIESKAKLKFIFCYAGNDETSAVNGLLTLSNAGAKLIIGPVFNFTAKHIIDVLDILDLHAITLSNDQTLTSPRIHVLGVSKYIKLDGMARYFLHHDIKNVALLTQRSAESINTEVLLSKAMKEYDLSLRVVSYYKSGSPESIRNAISTISKNRKFTYIRNKDGTVAKNRQSQDGNGTLIRGKLDAIYVDANSADAAEILFALNEFNISNNMVVFYNDDAFGPFNTNYADSEATSPIIFVSNMNEYSVPKHIAFESVMGYKHNIMSALAYDAATIAIYAYDYGSLQACIDNRCDINGASGRFYFNQKKLLTRTFGVYKIINDTSMIDTFDYYHKNERT